MKKRKNRHKQHSTIIAIYIDRESSNEKSQKNLNPKSYTIIGYNYRVLYRCFT